MHNNKTGRIYKIIHNQSNIVYVGSTFDALRNRWINHKRHYQAYLRGAHSEIAIYPYFKEYGFDNFKIVLIKEYEVIDKKHLLAYESLWISKLKSINKNNTFYIRKIYNNKYYKNNVDNLKEYQKEYRLKNIDKIKEQKKKYRLKNADKIKERKKEYYNNNADKLKEKKKEYYKEKIKCECGSEIRKDSKVKHLRSKKHQNFLNNN